MDKVLTGAALAAELTESARELDALRARVESRAQALPTVETSRWNGPASWAYQMALALLHRQTRAATDLLRCAADLSAAAAFEVNRNA
jgi:uncharacterized protein YukE